MVKIESRDVSGRAKRPIGYEVAPINEAAIRQVSNEIRNVKEVSDYYRDGGVCLNAVNLLENVLFHAGARRCRRASVVACEPHQTASKRRSPALRRLGLATLGVGRAELDANPERLPQSAQLDAGHRSHRAAPQRIKDELDPL